MRISQVTLRYPPASGGVEDYVHTLVERLRAAGEDVSVETTALRTHHPATYLDEPLDDPPHVHRHPVRTFRRFAYPVPRGLNSTLETQHSECIHAHGFWYAPADIAARVAHKRGIPFVLSTYFAPREKFFWNLYRTVRGNHTMELADAVVVISPQEEAALRAAGFSPRHVELIPPGINLSEYGPGRPNPFIARGLDEKRILFFAGRTARAKGIDLLIAALPRILRFAQDDEREVHLAVAGEDFGELESFKREAQKLGVSNHISWLGKLPREELLAAYQHADVFVFPSRYEAFGIAPLEAQAAGCPVVATNTASLPFVVQHKQTGLLFLPEDVYDLAHNVITILKDRTLAERLGRAGRTRAIREFTWDESVRKLRRLYENLVRIPVARS